MPRNFRIVFLPVMHLSAGSMSFVFAQPQTPASFVESDVYFSGAPDYQSGSFR
jgi:hypothetical protein